MNNPVRIQRKRTKGFNLQAESPNGLPVVYVGRPTKWGNPWTSKGLFEAGFFIPEYIPELLKQEYRGWLSGEWKTNPALADLWNKLESRRQWILDHIGELRGKNLACWCPVDKPCHADILLKMANEVEDEL